MQVQNLKPEACYRMVVTSEETAKIMLKEVIKYLGLCFHPDIPAKDYTTNEGKPTFEKFEAEFLDANLLNASNLLYIYEYSIEVWAELGMITDKQHQTLEGETTMKFDYKAECDKLEKLIDGFVNHKINELGDGRFCASVTRDNCLNDSVGVRFLEEDGSTLVMDMLADMADYLFTHSGRYYSISNNSPTDGYALVFVDPEMDEVFDKYHFATEFADGFNDWLKNPENWKNRPHQYIVYQALDDYLDRACDGITNWKNHLKYNEEMWYQVMSWTRNGF